VAENVLRSVDVFAALVERLAGLVRKDLGGNPDEQARHASFLTTRIVAGAFGLACIPPYLAWRGVPSLAEYLVILCLGAPLAAAVCLSRTGRLAAAHGISSAGFAGIVVSAGVVSGGLASPAIMWLLASPVEALLSASWRAAAVAAAVSMAGLVAIAALDLAPGSWTATWSLAGVMPIFAAAVIGHAGAIAVAQMHASRERRAAAGCRDARQRSFLDTLDTVVTWHDRNGLVTEVTGPAQEILGVGPCALQGRGLFAKVHVSDRPAFLKALSDAASSARTVGVRFRVHAAEPSGVESRVIWVEMRARGVPQGDERCAVVATTRDVTASARHAEEIETARGEAERVEEAKGQFLATVSHELRTPLNAIIGFSEVLSSDAQAAGDAERRKEYVRIIKESGEHLLQVVNTLLDVSKIKAGTFDVLPEPFDAAAFTHGCCDLMGLRAERAGILLARDIATDLPELVADRRACKQILINLLSNAIKFTPRGGHITVAARRDGDRILFVVSDTGAGIDEKDLPKLGSPFFQARSSYDRRNEGTGLGLSVVRGLVGLHRGSLTIESAPEEGTIVTVELPIDCRGGPVQKNAPIRIHTLPRPQSNVRTLKVG
jgi:cell cycle sensor histidine kinase DivJ